MFRHAAHPCQLAVAILLALLAFPARAKSECPALVGTYSVGQTAWIDLIYLHATGTVRPKGQRPQRVTLRPKGDGHEMIWHMPRPAVHAAARLLADGDPRKYGQWLDLALREPPLATPGNAGNQVWVNELAFLGPVFRVDVDLPLKECERGWFLLGKIGRGGPPDLPGGMDGHREAQLWLQRSPEGHLTLRWRERKKLVVISESRYSTERSILLWGDDHTEHWPAAPNSDLSPLREDELPTRSTLPKCRKDNQRENDFFLRLDAVLPRGAQHVNRARGGLYIGRMRSDGSCEPMQYWVTLSAAHRDDLAALEAFLKSDPFLAGMTLREIDPQPDGRVLAKYWMNLAP